MSPEAAAHFAAGRRAERIAGGARVELATLIIAGGCVHQKRLVAVIVARTVIVRIIAGEAAGVIGNADADAHAAFRVVVVEPERFAADGPAAAPAVAECDRAVDLRRPGRDK